MNIRRFLLASVAALAISAASPSRAAISVFDAIGNSQLVIQTTEMVKNTAYWAQQIKAMTDLLTLQNIMNEVLGEGLGTAFTDLLNASQSLYDSGAGAYYSVANMQNRLTGEMSLFLPPAGGYSSMDMRTMLYRSRRISEMATKNSAASAMWTSAAMDRQRAALAQAQTGAAQAARSVSAVSATQAAAHILAAQSQQLDQIARSAGLLATNLEQEILRRESHEGMVQAQWDRNQEDMKAMTEALPQGIAITSMRGY